MRMTQEQVDAHQRKHFGRPVAAPSRLLENAPGLHCDACNRIPIFEGEGGTCGCGGTFRIKEGPKAKLYYDNLANPPGVSHPKQRKQPKALARSDEGKAPRPGPPHVRFGLRRIQLLDVDAKWASVKDLLDGLQIAGLIRGDREGEITLEVTQERVTKKAEEGTIIDIENPDGPAFTQP